MNEPEVREILNHHYDHMCHQVAFEISRACADAKQMEKHDVRGRGKPKDSHDHEGFKGGSERMGCASSEITTPISHPGMSADTLMRRNEAMFKALGEIASLKVSFIPKECENYGYLSPHGFLSEARRIAHNALECVKPKQPEPVCENRFTFTVSNAGVKVTSSNSFGSEGEAAGACRNYIQHCVRHGVAVGIVGLVHVENPVEIG